MLAAPMNLAAALSCLAQLENLDLAAKLAGDESLRLEVVNQETGTKKGDTASIEKLDCDPEIPVDCPDELEVSALGACDEESKDGKDATFTFYVDVDECDETRLYGYDFSSNKTLKGWREMIPICIECIVSKSSPPAECTASRRYGTRGT